MQLFGKIWGRCVEVFVGMCGRMFGEFVGVWGGKAYKNVLKNNITKRLETYEFMCSIMYTSI